MPPTDIIVADYTADAGSEDRTYGGTVAAPPAASDTTVVPGGGSSGCCCGDSGVSVACCPDGQSVPRNLTLTVTTAADGGCPECVGTFSVDLVYDPVRVTWISVDAWDNPNAPGNTLQWEVACFGTWHASLQTNNARTPTAGTMDFCWLYAAGGIAGFGFTDNCDPFFLTSTGDHSSTCPRSPFGASVTATVTPT